MMDRSGIDISTLGRYKADLICKIDCDLYLIEHDMTPHYQGLLGDKQLGVGAVDVQAPNVEKRATWLPIGSQHMVGWRRSKPS